MPVNEDVWSSGNKSKLGDTYQVEIFLNDTYVLLFLAIMIRDGYSKNPKLEILPVFTRIIDVK